MQLTSVFYLTFLFLAVFFSLLKPLLPSVAVHTQREAEFRAYFLHVERSRCVSASVRFTCLRLCVCFCERERESVRAQGSACENGVKHGNEIRRNL